jgi:hypothetical protein
MFEIHPMTNSLHCIVLHGAHGMTFDGPHNNVFQLLAKNRCHNNMTLNLFSVYILLFRIIETDY